MSTASKLKELAEVYTRAKELETEILAVSFDNIEKLKRHAKRNAILFHLLSDVTGEITLAFTCTDIENNVPFPSIFIADRFGVSRYQKIVSEAHELLEGKDILSWLLLIQTESPECSHL